MKSIRSNTRNHAVEGDERIRTAEQAPGADSAYEALTDIAKGRWNNPSGATFWDGRHRTPIEYAQYALREITKARKEARDA